MTSKLGPGINSRRSGTYASPTKMDGEGVAIKSYMYIWCSLTTYLVLSVLYDSTYTNIHGYIMCDYICKIVIGEFINIQRQIDIDRQQIDNMLLHH